VKGEREREEVRDTGGKRGALWGKSFFLSVKSFCKKEKRNNTTAKRME
jgi:hypothetical protein